jgi:cytochrome c biogenesis factor
MVFQSDNVIKREDFMNRVKALRITNLLLFLVFMGIAISGLTAMLFPGLIPYSTFRVAHPFTGATFVALVITHIALNFNWIKANYLKKKK